MSSRKIFKISKDMSRKIEVLTSKLIRKKMKRVKLKEFKVFNNNILKNLTKRYSKYCRDRKKCELLLKELTTMYYVSDVVNILDELVKHGFKIDDVLSKFNIVELTTCLEDNSCLEKLREFSNKDYKVERRVMNVKIKSFRKNQEEISKSHVEGVKVDVVSNLPDKLF